jgi:hypothetical protein
MISITEGDHLDNRPSVSYEAQSNEVHWMHDSVSIGAGGVRLRS